MIKLVARPMMRRAMVMRLAAAAAGQAPRYGDEAGSAAGSAAVDHVAPCSGVMAVDTGTMLPSADEWIAHDFPVIFMMTRVGSANVGWRPTWYFVVLFLPSVAMHCQRRVRRAQVSTRLGPAESQGCLFLCMLSNCNRCSKQADIKPQ
nr:hypothetical protein [Herbaspirillum sp. ASV7]